MPSRSRSRSSRRKRGKKRKGNSFNVTKSQTNSESVAETSSDPETSNDTPEELQINPQDLDSPRSERVAITAPENAPITDNASPISSNIRNRNLPEPLNATTPEEPLQIPQAMDTSRSQTTTTTMGNAPVMDRATPPSSLTGARKKTNARYQAENFPKTLGNPETPTATPAEPPQITQSTDTSISQRGTIIAPEKTPVMNNAAPLTPLTGEKKKKQTYSNIESVPKTPNDPEAPNVTHEEPPQISKAIHTSRSQRETIIAPEKIPVFDNVAPQIERVPETVGCPEPQNVTPEEPSQTPQDASRFQRGTIIPPEKTPVMNNATPPTPLTGDKKKTYTHSQIESIPVTVRGPEPPNVVSEQPPQIPQSIEKFKSQRRTIVAREKAPIMDNAAPPSSLARDKKKKQTHSQIESVPDNVSSPEPSNVTPEEPSQIPQDTSKSQRGTILAPEKTPVMDNTAPSSSLAGDKKKKHRHFQMESVPETLSGLEPSNVTSEKPPQIPQSIDSSRSQSGTIIATEKTPIIKNAAPPSSLTGDKKKRQTHTQIESVPETVSGPEPPNITPEEPPQIPQNTYKFQRGTIITPEKTTLMDNPAPPSSLTETRKKIGNHIFYQDESIPETPHDPDHSNATPEERLQIPQALETCRSRREAITDSRNTLVIDHAKSPSSLSGIKEKKEQHSYSQPESVSEASSDSYPPNAKPEEPSQISQALYTNISQNEAKKTLKNATVMDYATPPSCLIKTPIVPELPNSTFAESLQIPQAFNPSRSKRKAITVSGNTLVMDNDKSMSSLSGTKEKTEKHSYSQAESVSETSSDLDPPNVSPEEPSQIPQTINTFRSQRGAIIAPGNTSVRDIAAPLSSFCKIPSNPEYHKSATEEPRKIPKVLDSPRSHEEAETETETDDSLIEDAASDITNEFKHLLVSSFDGIMDLLLFLNKKEVRTASENGSVKNSTTLPLSIVKTSSVPEPKNASLEEPIKNTQAPETPKSQRGAVTPLGNAPITDSTAPPLSHIKTPNLPKPLHTTSNLVKSRQAINTSRSQSGATITSVKAPANKTKPKEHTYCQTSEGIIVTSCDTDPSNATPEEPPQIPPALYSTISQREAMITSGNTPVIENFALSSSLDKTHVVPETPNAIPEEPLRITQVLDISRSQKKAIAVSRNTQVMNDANSSSSLSGTKKKTKKVSYSQAKSVSETSSNLDPPNVSPEEPSQILQTVNNHRSQPGAIIAPGNTPVRENASPPSSLCETLCAPEPHNATSEREIIAASGNAPVIDNDALPSSLGETPSDSETPNVTSEEPLQIPKAFGNSRSQRGAITVSGNAPVIVKATLPSSLIEIPSDPKPPNAIEKTLHIPQTLDTSRSQRKPIIAPENSLIHNLAPPLLSEAPSGMGLPNAIPEEPIHIPQAFDTLGSHKEAIKASGNALVIGNPAPPSSLSEIPNCNEPSNSTPEKKLQILQDNSRFERGTVIAPEKTPVMDKAAPLSSLTGEKKKKLMHSEIGSVPGTVSCPEPPNVISKEPPQISQSMDTSRSQRGTIIASVMDSAAPPLSPAEDKKKKHAHYQIKSAAKTISGHEPPIVTPEHPPQIPQAIDTFRSQKRTIINAENTPEMDNATPPSSLTGDKKKKNIREARMTSENVPVMNNSTLPSSVVKTPSFPEPKNTSLEEPLKIPQAPKFQRGAATALANAPITDSTEPLLSQIKTCNLSEPLRTFCQTIESVIKASCFPDPSNATPEEPPQIPPALCSTISQREAMITSGNTPVIENFALSSSLDKTHVVPETPYAIPEEPLRITQDLDTSRFRRKAIEVSRNTLVMNDANSSSSLSGIKKKTEKHSYSQAESVSETSSNLDPPNVSPEEPSQISQTVNNLRSQKGAIIAPGNTSVRENASPLSSLCETPCAPKPQRIISIWEIIAAFGNAPVIDIDALLSSLGETPSDSETPNVTSEEPLQIPKAFGNSRSQRGAITVSGNAPVIVKATLPSLLIEIPSDPKPPNAIEKTLHIPQALDTSRSQRKPIIANENSLIHNAAPPLLSEVPSSSDLPNATPEEPLQILQAFYSLGSNREAIKASGNGLVIGNPSPPSSLWEIHDCPEPSNATPEEPLQIPQTFDTSNSQKKAITSRENAPVMDGAVVPSNIEIPNGPESTNVTHEEALQIPQALGIYQSRGGAKSDLGNNLVTDNVKPPTSISGHKNNEGKQTYSQVKSVSETPSKAEPLNDKPEEPLLIPQVHDTFKSQRGAISALGNDLATNNAESLSSLSENNQKTKKHTNSEPLHTPRSRRKAITAPGSTSATDNVKPPSTLTGTGMKSRKHTLSQAEKVPETRSDLETLNATPEEPAQIPQTVDTPRSQRGAIKAPGNAPIIDTAAPPSSLSENKNKTKKHTHSLPLDTPRSPRAKTALLNTPVTNNAKPTSSLTENRNKSGKYVQSQAEDVPKTCSDPETPNVTPEELSQVPQTIDIPRSQRGVITAPGNTPEFDNGSTTSSHKVKTVPEPPNATPEESFPFPQELDSFRSQREAKTASGKATLSSLASAKKETRKDDCSDNNINTEENRKNETCTLCELI